MKTIVLAGGFGTRLAGETESKPKPMVEIGHRPILWHIMNGYAAHGHKEFIVALGYKGHVIKEYFMKYFHMWHDLSIDLSSGTTDVHDGTPEDWEVHLIDTGLNTHVGGRMKRLSSSIGNETFMMTYGDGVSNVDIAALLEFHQSHDKIATVTAVRPPARFGGITFDGDIVAEFVEKPQISEGWINGGFFVLEPGVLDYIDGDDTNFERETLERLAQDRQLAAFRHNGFWQCMDTPRDLQLLNQLWESGDAPWKPVR